MVIALEGPEVVVSFLGIALYLVIMSAVGRIIGSYKDRGTAGFWFGVFLGPIGWLIVALLPPSERFEIERAVRVKAAVDQQPGWLPDPLGNAPYRWFDGQRWTTDLTDLPSASAPMCPTTAPTEEPSWPDTAVVFEGGDSTAETLADVLRSTGNRSSAWIRHKVTEAVSSGPAVIKCSDAAEAIELADQLRQVGADVMSPR